MRLGLDLSLKGSGASGGVTSYEGLVATRARFATANVGGNTKGMSRSAHIATDNITSLKIAVANFLFASGANGDKELGNANTATVTASVEYPASTFTQILFSGSATGNLAAVPTTGATTTGGLIISDATTVTIPLGATFFIRMFYQSAGGIIYVNTTRDAALGDLYNVGAGATDQTMSGTITNNAGTAYCPPAAILATTSTASLIAYGDSICWGQADTTPTDSRMGLICRGLNTGFAFLNMGSPGATAQTIIARSPNRALLFAKSSHLVTQFGVNDVFLNGRTSAQLVSDITGSVWAAFPAATKKIAATITPESTTTDSWATIVNQTAKTQNAERNTYNAAVRTGLTGQYAYFDTGVQIENSADTDGKFKVDGTANKYTADGTHPSAFAYAAVASSGAVDNTKFTYP